MKTPTKKPAGIFTACIQRAFESVHGQTGVSKDDLFYMGMAFASLGLIAVNIDFLPPAMRVVGWTAVFCGTVGMIFLRRIL